MSKYESLNPFFGIIETYRFPHARTERTSFSEKMGDAFTVLYGKHEGDLKHPGIIDYATLFFRDVSAWAKINTGFLSFLADLYCCLVVVQAFIILALLSTAWLFVSLPIVSLIQWGNRLFSGNDREDVLELQGSVELENGPEQTNFRSFLSTNALELNDVKVITFLRGETNLTVDDECVYDVCIASKNINNEKPTPTFTAQFSPSSRVKTFFTLNIGGLTRRLEDENQTDVLDTFCANIYPS